MSELQRPIGYLENHDFNSTGNLINTDIPKNIPVVIMLQTSWCPHCTNAKPAFQDFANKHKGKVFCATIQQDGERESERILGARLQQLKPTFRGFPDYLLYVNGRLVSKEINGRGVEDLEEFAEL